MRSAHVAVVCSVLAGCVWWTHEVKVPRETPTTNTTNFRREQRVTPRPSPFVAVTVTRIAGALRLHVTSAQRCRIDVLKAEDTGYPDGRVERGQLELETSREDVCYGAHLAPASDVDVGLEVGSRLRVLGATSTNGDLEVTLPALDALFQEGSVQPSQLAQVLVHGVKAAELPLGEIVNRQRQIDATLAKCEQALARTDAERELLARRLAELLDLRLQGSADPRISQTAQRLYARLSLIAAKQKAEAQELASTDPNAGWRAAPGRFLTRAKKLLSQLSTSEEQGAVPEHVKRDIDATDVQPSTFEWAMGSLPTVCKITVTGGAAVAATLVATGPTGIALNVVMGMLGDDLSEWLTNRCCELAANSVTDVQSAICDTDSKALESDSG